MQEASYTCLACQSSNRRNYSFDYAEQTPFTPTGRLEFFECLSCGFVRNSRFDVERCADYYSTNASGYMGSGQFSLLSKDLVSKHEAQLTFIRSFYHSGKWLDLGCCDGALQQHARMQAYFDDRETEFNAIDLKTKHLEKLGESLNIKFYEGDIELGELPEGLSDISLFTLMHVLEHLNDPLTLLKSLKKLSTADSTLVIETPDREGYNFEYSPEFWYSLVEHVNHFNLTSLVQLVTRAGWRLERGERYIGRSPGLNYPAVILAFKPTLESEQVLPKTSYDLDLVVLNLLQLAEQLNKIASRERVCFWGASKFFKLLSPRLNKEITLYDAKIENCDHYLGVSILKVPPSPDCFDRIIVTAIASFDAVKSVALQTGWSPDRIFNVLQFKLIPATPLPLIQSED